MEETLFDLERSGSEYQQRKRVLRKQATRGRRERLGSVDGAGFQLVVVELAAGLLFRADLLSNVSHRLICHLANPLPRQIQQAANLLKSHFAVISNIQRARMLQLTDVSIGEVDLQCPGICTDVKIEMVST